MALQYKSRFSACFVTPLISYLELGASRLAAFKMNSLKLVFAVWWILACLFKQFFMQSLP